MPCWLLIGLFAHFILLACSLKVDLDTLVFLCSIVMVLLGRGHKGDKAGKGISPPPPRFKRSRSLSGWLALAVGVLLAPREAQGGSEVNFFFTDDLKPSFS